MDLTLLLPLMMLFPLLGAAVIALVGRGADPAPATGGATQAQPKADNVPFWTSLVASLVTLVIGLVIATKFDWSPKRPWDLQLAHAWVWIRSFGLSFGFGVDAISLLLILLTVLLMPLTIMGSFTAVKERRREFYFWLLVLQTFMLGTFLATDLIFFYICFEFTLVPLYFLIGIFGSTDRLRAARVFFLYTFTGSMLTFAGVLYVAWFNFAHTQTWTFDIQTLYGAAQMMSPQQQAWVFLALLAGFAVKVPIFPFHTWLPLAHTEAPTAGSVILAGVLLKLGTYGLLRFAIPMTPYAVLAYAPTIATLAIIGILYTALICWVQKDIKKLIAYSSVSHLGFCVLGMFAVNAIGIGGSVMYMVNHGLSTGALFLCVGMIYERFHTREMARMGGLAKVMPIWASFMVFFTLASVGLPGLNGFVGEFLTLLGAFTSPHTLGPMYASVAAVGMILGAIYLLYMLGRVVWGPLKVPSADGHGGDHGPTVTDLNGREIATLAPLAVACLVLGLFPTPMLKSLEPAIVQLTGPVNQAVAVHAFAAGHPADPVAMPVSRLAAGLAPRAAETGDVRWSKTRGASPAANLDLGRAPLKEVAR